MEILASDLPPISHILASDIDVARIESNKDIKDEDKGNDIVGDFILEVVFKIIIDILKWDNEGIENSKEHNKHVPGSLVLRQITECLNTLLLCSNLKSVTENE